MKTRRLFPALGLSCLLCLLTTTGYASATTENRVARALESYDRALEVEGEQRLERMKDSLKDWQELRREVGENAGLEYNLGTTFLHLEDFGRGIYHLRAAIRLAPGDARIHHQLQRALRLAGVEPESDRRSGPLALAQRRWTATDPDIWNYMALFWSWGWLSFFAVRRSWPTLAGGSALALVAVALLGAGSLRHNGYGTVREVVLLESFKPRKGMSLSEAPAFEGSLPPGSGGLLLREELGWIEARWGETRGWIPAEKGGVLE